VGQETQRATARCFELLKIFLDRLKIAPFRGTVYCTSASLGSTTRRTKLLMNERQAAIPRIPMLHDSQENAKGFLLRRVFWPRKDGHYISFPNQKELRCLEIAAEFILWSLSFT
jgi:hypothetical protein